MTRSGRSSATRSSPAGSQPRAVTRWRRVCWRWSACCRRWKNPTDRDAADAVRTRLDWKYTLGLALDDAGFRYSVLSEFRDRLAVDERGVRLLELMLDAVKHAGLLRGGGKARTDSTHVLAKISALRRLERVGETVRAALNQLAQTAGGWLAPRIHPEWEQRYGRRIDSAHLPAAEQAWNRFGQAVAADGAALLAAIGRGSRPRVRPFRSRGMTCRRARQPRLRERHIGGGEPGREE